MAGEANVYRAEGYVHIHCPACGERIRVVARADRVARVTTVKGTRVLISRFTDSVVGHECAPVVDQIARQREEARAYAASARNQDSIDRAH